ncbi:MAG: helix-turn-helix domain-containing protein [Pseudomonadota bacterium]
MDGQHRSWYYSSMAQTSPIPVFTLFGTTEPVADLVHYEPIAARSAPLNWRISAHRHASLVQVLAVEDGEAQAQVDGIACLLGPGEYIFIPAQSVHAFRFAPGTGGFVLSIPSDLAQSLGPASADLADNLAQSFSGKIGPRLQTLSKLLCETDRMAARYRSPAALGLALAVLAELADEQSDANGTAPPRGHARLDRLARLIAAHRQDGWTAADYARALGVSTGHLSRQCRAATGRGAQAFIEHALMTEASRRLAFTDLSVAEIGYQLGYADPSYFSRRFRAARGIAPTRYRAKFAHQAH